MRYGADNRLWVTECKAAQIAPFKQDTRATDGSATTAMTNPATLAFPCGE